MHDIPSEASRIEPVQVQAMRRTDVLNVGLQETSNRNFSGAGSAPAALQVTAPGVAAKEALGLRHFLRILREGRQIIATSVILSLILALAYVSLAPARFVASASVLVVPGKLRLLTQESVISDQPTDQYFIGSQVQLLKSEAVAERVVEHLGLANSQDIAADDAVFLLDEIRVFKAKLEDVVKAIGKSLLLWSAAEPQTEVVDPVQSAVVTLKKNLIVEPAGLFSHVLTVSYKSADRYRAANVANGFVEAYIEDKRDYISRAAHQTVKWLETRLSVARRGLKSAEQAIDDFRAGNTGSTGPRYRFRLKELEATAQSYRVLHGSLLQRFTDAEVGQEQSFPSVGGARILDKAKVPLEHSWPRTGLVFLFAVSFGLTFGAGIALLHDVRMLGFRSVQDLESVLGIRAFGLLPKVRASERVVSANTTDRICAKLTGAAHLVLDSPCSRAADVIRAAWVDISQRRNISGSCVVGITSAIAGEGRATVCMNLAQMIAASGNSVLVVDADWREGHLSEALTDSGPPGLVQVLLGEIAFPNAVWKDPVSGASFLPASSGRKKSDSLVKTLSITSLSVSPIMRQTMLELSKKFEYVIVCLPPMSSTSDVYYAIDWVDSFLLVVEWKKTSREVVEKALKTLSSLGGKISGAIINKVVLKSRRDKLDQA